MRMRRRNEASLVPKIRHLYVKLYSQASPKTALHIILQDPMKFIGIPQLDQQLTVLFPDSPIMINSPGRYLSH